MFFYEICQQIYIYFLLVSTFFCHFKWPAWFVQQNWIPVAVVLGGGESRPYVIILGGIMGGGEPRPYGFILGGGISRRYGVQCDYRVHMIRHYLKNI